MGSLNDMFECTYIFYTYAQDPDMTKYAQYGEM